MRKWLSPVVCLLAGTSTLVPGSLAGGLAIGWSDLRPPSQEPYATVVSTPMPAAESDAQLTGPLDGRTVELTGYLLPFDRDGDSIFGFLLLPWTGACSHTPAPRANQIVLVYPATPFTSSGIYQPVTVTGTLELELEKTQVLMIDGARVIQSGYRVGRAEVAPADEVRDGLAVKADSPWPFLRK